MHEFLLLLRDLIEKYPAKNTVETGRPEPAFFWAKFMLKNNTMVQRKHKRIELPKTIVLNPHNACELVNISRGGLLFKSLNWVVWPDKWLLNIITMKRELDIEHCPVELVWMKTDHSLTSSSILVENVGVKFGNLDKSQGAKLDYLLSQ